MWRFCCCAGLTALLSASTFAADIVLDGTADAAYCNPIAVQNQHTRFGNSTLGQIDKANGSELDAAYAYVQDGVLYLVIAGNIESNFNKLDLWFDTGEGGQNRVLDTNAFDGVNRQGGNGVDTGLKFDNNFAATHWLSFTGGGDDYTIYIDYCKLRIGDDPGEGYYVGAGKAANQTDNGNLDGSGNNPFGIRVTINNSNVLGVVGGDVGYQEDGLAAEVTTGAEFAIPLDAIGSPSGNFTICAYINGGGHDFLSNQVLGAIGTPSDNLAEPRNVDFSAQEGDQYFEVVADRAACGACCIAETCSLTSAAECAGDFLGENVSCFGNPCSVVETGACCLNQECSLTTGADCATAGGDYLGDNSSCAGAPCLEGACCIGTSCSIQREEECTGNGGAFLGDGSTCDGNPCARGACCLGELCVVISPVDCSNQNGDYQGDDTNCSGDPCNAPDGQPVMDGTADEAYGDALAIQDTQTGFGDSNLGLVDRANGSELDQAFGVVVGDRLFLTLAGNLESNFNDLEIFLDTREGGQNQLRGDNPDVDFNGLNRMGASDQDPPGPGLQFDEDFFADFYLTIQNGGTPYALFANYAELRVDDDNPGFGLYLGKGNAVTDGGLSGGNNPSGVAVTVNNSNIDGVPGGLGFEFNGGEGVLTGVEISIPLSAIGNPQGDFKVMAVVNGQRHDFLSQQTLAGGCWILGGYPGEPRTASFAEDVVFDRQNFTVAYTPPPPSGIRGDSNCDGFVNFDDIDCFVAAIIGEANWNDCGHGDDCSYLTVNDINQDDSVDFGDIDPFVQCIINETCE